MTRVLILTVLPTGNDTRQDLIEIRSDIVNETSKQRSFSISGAVQERSTVTENKWSSEIQVIRNVTPDSNGEYSASLGFVPIAVVNLNAAGIISINDIRTFYNVFDPDFFSVYGRKNLNFSIIYDNINIIELPYNFTDFVPKIDQVDVRKFERSRLDSTVSTTEVQHDYDFILNEPTSTQTTIQRRDFLNTTTTDGVVSYSDSNFTSDANASVFDLFTGTVNFTSGNLSVLHIRDLNSAPLINILSSLQVASHVYLHFWKSSLGEPSLTNSIVYEIPTEDINLSTLFNILTWNGDLSPSFSSEKISNEFNRLRVSTENPVTLGSGIPNYVDPSASAVIPNFFSISEVIYNPNIRRFSFDLTDTTIQMTAQTFSGARNVSRDFDLNSSNDDASGIWSDGTTVWVADNNDRKLYAYTLATGARDTSREFNFHSNQRFSQGIWSDGTTMWILESPNRIFAYTLSTGARDTNKEIQLHSNNLAPIDIWSDGTTMWVTDHSDQTVYAYTLATGSRDMNKEFSLGRNDATGIWSDRTTVWVGFLNSSSTRAYNLETGIRDTSREFTLDSSNTNIRCLWSNGTTMWSLDNNNSRRIYAYTLFTSDSSFTSEINTNGIFSNLVLRKGTDIRLSKDLSDFTVVVEGNKANFSYVLLAGENIIESTDSLFDDFSLEFHIIEGDLGIPTWITTPLLKTRDYTIIEDAGRTYIRFNDQLNLRSGDEILFSHVVPDDLVLLVLVIRVHRTF